MKRMNWLMFGVAIVACLGVATSAVADESTRDPKRRPGLTTTPPTPKPFYWMMVPKFKWPACSRANQENCLT
jgi:hypothetical protein